MSRYKIPPRVAPSPAAGEPGLQNAAARLRSSRDVQARLLEERRAKTEAEATGGTASAGSGHPSLNVTTRGSDGDSTAGIAAPTQQPEVNGDKLRKPGKEKLVILFRLPRATVTQIALIPGVADLGEAYVLGALAKEARAALRGLTGESDLVALLDIAKVVRSLPSSKMTVGEAMTVYVESDTLSAMHRALGDPWRVLPKATVVGAFLAAIVTRLIEARLER